MKFVLATPEEMETIVTRRKKVMKMVDEFWQSDLQVVKVEIKEGEYKSVASAQSSFAKAIKRLNVGVFAVKRGEKLYLVKEKP